MSRDLALGTTPRDWSAGMSREESRLAYHDAVAYRDVAALARAVETETQRNFQESLRLHSAGKLPEDDRRAFGQTLRKWHALRDSRQGKYAGEDFVALTNVKDENLRHSRRFAELASSPVPPRGVPLTPPRDPTGTSWRKAVPVAAGAAALLVLSQLTRKT
jgi:hypothetical protein